MTEQTLDIPGYTLVKRIGQGGMAMVYLAVQQSLDRQVALKVMRAARHQEEKFSERFFKEGRIIAQLQHPQIITIYDFGSHDNYNYFSMEFVPGGTLAEQITAGLAPERAVEVIRAVSTALAYAHKHGVIHRDIKPQNVLFRQDGTPVLSDFGIAKVLDSDDTQLTIPGFTVGSPVYMSPEQITGKKLDSRADLYSLGIVFYEMLAKQPPFRADNINSIALMHCTQPVPRLPSGFGQFQSVLQKLLAKEPKDRFANAEEFIDALDRTSSRPSFYALLDTARVTQSLNTSFQSKKPFWIGGLSLMALVAGSGGYLLWSKAPSWTETDVAISEPQPVTEKLIPASHYQQLALKHLQNGEFAQSLDLIKLGLQVTPDDQKLLALREQVQQQQQVSSLLAQAQQYYQDGQLEQSQRQVEEGLRLVPQHQGLTELLVTVQAALRKRQQQADQLLGQAHLRWQAGDLEGSLASIEQGLQRVSSHPELLTLRTQISNRLKEKRDALQLQAQAEQLLAQGQLEESLKRIEEGLRLVAGQPDLLSLRDRVNAALDVSNRSTELLRHCTARFPLESLSSTQGNEVLACYQQMMALSPNNDQAQTWLQQIANRYAELAKTAIGKSDLTAADDYLAQLVKIQPNHPQRLSLNQALQTQRERTAIEAQRVIENQTQRRTVEENKRRSTGNAKREPSPAIVPKRSPTPADTPAKPAVVKVLKEVAPSPKPPKPKREVATQSRPRGLKSNCREALMKAQLGEPLSAIEQEECR